MDSKTVKAYFDSKGVVDYYAKAAAELGLWESEEKVFGRLFNKDDSLLELGCGVGRIAFGLHEMGFRNLLASDYSKSMVQRARQLSDTLEYRIPFRLCDATNLEFEDNVFDGAIFGFNGLMQIPGAALREQALNEVYRVIRPGAWFVFTSHDRARSPHQDFWSAEKLRWEYGTQKSDLDNFGDRMEPSDVGAHFMHVPTVDEVQSILKKVGFRLEATIMRSELANESAKVKAFSDDCRFWIVEKA